MRSLMLFAFIGAFTTFGFAQSDATTFTGTALIYGTGFNTRTTTRNFTLRLTGQTSPTEVDRLIGVLQDEGQDALLKEIDDQKVGTFSLGNQVARDVNAVNVTEVDGKTRIRAVFARWIGFGEVRGGYRSTDYPFSYIEIFVDPKTGKGEGTFIAAARIRYKSKNGANEVEIEDFGTFPSKLMGVQVRGRMSL